MDRLSAYAAREAEERSPEEQAEAEEKAAVELMERLKIAKSTKEVTISDATGSLERESKEQQQTNGDVSTTDEQSELQTLVGDSAPSTTESVNGDKARAIPTDVKLFEIFHEQVMNLVSMQRLAIQDITALLVSLGNLSLYVDSNISSLFAADIT